MFGYTHFFHDTAFASSKKCKPLIKASRKHRQKENNRQRFKTRTAKNIRQTKN